jgi:hypothetical protein
MTNNKQWFSVSGTFGYSYASTVHVYVQVRVFIEFEGGGTRVGVTGWCGGVSEGGGGVGADSDDDRSLSILDADSVGS